MEKKSIVISIIGRPNVGKSTIFNRLMRKSTKAITHDLPGVTRDRHYGITAFDDFDIDKESEVILVDTGGFYPKEVHEDLKNINNKNALPSFFNIMKDHAKVAISESDLVLLVVDVREGINPLDKEIVNYLRKVNKEFWLIVNKYDSDKQDGDEIDFYSLGINSDNLYRTSSAHGIGFTTLREKIHEKALKSGKNEIVDLKLQEGILPREDVVAKVAIIGTPNAGKSTLLNQLVGSKRALVSDIAGTTVDPIDGYFDLYFGKEAEEFNKKRTRFHTVAEAKAIAETEANAETEAIAEAKAIAEAEAIAKTEAVAGSEAVQEVAQEEIEKEVGSYWRTVHIVDTAGIRKQKKVQGVVESQSVYRSLKSISEANVVLYVVDATIGIGHQERRLIDVALEKGKSIIVCLNKVDLLEEQVKDEKARAEWILNIRRELPWLEFCEMIPLSAKKGSFLGKLKKSLKNTIQIRNFKTPTGELNKCISSLVDRNPIFMKGKKGAEFKIKYASLVKNNPPTFILFSNRSKDIPQNYRRYLTKGIREYFNYINTPIHLIFKNPNLSEK